MSSYENFTKLMVSILVLVLTMRCSPDDEGKGGKFPQDDPLQPKPAVSTTVMGLIMDELGKPVSGAEVNVHGEMATTGPDGTFILGNIQVPGNRCVVHAKKEGYFAGIRGLTPHENGKTETRIVLMTSPVSHTFEAGTGVNATLPNGSEVRIPENGLVSADGDPYSGPVKMSVRHLDPTDENFGVLVPGGDMVARREDQGTSVLYSYGILRVQMTDLSGEMLQLAPGSTSTLVMNIPEAQLSTAPSEIPLWYFDEEHGVWQEEGSASRENNRYVGTVKHFTDWNCDVPTEGATIIGRLIDCDNNPAYGIVEFGQTTSDPQSSTTSGETDGKFSRRVPSGVSITVIISDPLLVTPLTKNERGKVIVVVPPLAPGQVYDVGDIQTFPCPSEVKATFKMGEGDALDYILLGTEHGFKYQSFSENEMNALIPPGIPATITFHTRNQITVIKRIDPMSENQIVDLGEIDLTSSLLEGNVQITGKTACHGSPESGGQVSVHWSSGEGMAGVHYAITGADGVFSIQAPVNKLVVVRSSTSNGVWEQEIQTPAAPGQTVDLGTIELCENSSVGDSGFKITGDGMNNTAFNLVSNQNSSASNGGFYFPGEDVTIVVVQDTDDGHAISMSFAGQGTGVRSELHSAVVTIQRRVGTENRYYVGGLIENTNQMTFNVTRYDNVGGVIEGTFSGSFYIQDSEGAYSGATVQVTEGKFSVLRYPDIQ